MMDTLIYLLLASRVIDIFGRITIIHDMNNAKERKLTCLSEDDGGALVWNDEISKESLKRSSKIKFYNVDKIKQDENKINCKMNEADDCWKSWSIEKWSLTNSLKTPLGPVFDKRWEELYSKYSEFTEYGIFDGLNRKVELENTTAFSLSVRSQLDEVDIILCNGSNIRQDSCYWIEMRAWKSNIQKCWKEIFAISEEHKSKCKVKVSYDHNPLSSTEWRTFLIMWDSITRKISVYDAAHNNVFMKYHDAEQTNGSNIYYAFITSNSFTFYRFHIYTFLHTIAENAALTSPVFQVYNQTICIQLLIGLCEECDVNIALYDAARKTKLKMLTVKGSSNATHGLPTWQFVTIEHSTNYTSSIMELTPQLNSNSSNPLWAIANVRQCPENGSFRKSVLFTNVNHKYRIEDVLYTPNLTCQKLFYNHHIIVKTSAKLNTSLDDIECPEGTFGPKCSISCDGISNAANDCKGIAVCYENGCTCFPGYKGSRCTQPCEVNTYGHECKKTCGSCNFKDHSTSPCSAITGKCNHGCNNSKMFYTPPLCQIGVKNDNMIVNSVGPTSIYLKIPNIIWKNDVSMNQVSFFYSFVLKDRNVTHWRPAFQNMTQLEGYFINLDPGTIYRVARKLRICVKHECGDFQSEWQIVETICTPNTRFTLTLEKRNLSINPRNNSNQLHACPSNWYEMTVQYTRTGEKILHYFITTFPVEVYLSRYLSWNRITVTIHHKNRTIFLKTIHTVEEVPSEVSDIQVSFVSDVNVNLTWKAPQEPNGQIVRYSVTLRIKRYLGCKKSTPNNPKIIYSTNDTTIAIPNLHPYATYIAQIVAYNSRFSSVPIEKSFTTNESAIATEVFSNVRVHEWNMTWELPENCETITGKLHARIEIHGISNIVKSFSVVETTSYRYLFLNELQLYGAESYVAKLYVIRHAKGLKNPFFYEEYRFKTPSGIPPRVANLEIYEIDNRQEPSIVHLRWQMSLQPSNGTLRIYRIQSDCSATDKCEIVDVEFNATCSLWQDYICGSISTYYENQRIEVVAYNIDVVEPSVPVEVFTTMFHDRVTDEPGDFIVTVLKYSVVNLQWRHPWITVNPLTHFRIEIRSISTTLQENDFWEDYNRSTNVMFEVTNYTSYYSTRLYLLPSTQYVVSIKAMTYAKKFSNAVYKKFETPSTLAFNGNLMYMSYKSISTVLLKIPPVVNNTKTSFIHVIIKAPQGSKFCDKYLRLSEDLRVQAGIQVNDVAWQATEVPTEILAGKDFIIGDNRFDGKAQNCPLQPKGMYDVIIIVNEPKPSVHSKSAMLKISIFNDIMTTMTREKWLVFILLISIASGIAYFFFQKKKEKTVLQETEMTLSEYMTYRNIRTPETDCTNF